MTGEELASKCLDIISKYRTKYAKGTFGQCATPAFLSSKAKQYPEWYTPKNAPSRLDMLLALPDETRLFDCVGLIKAVVWGFPNVVYTSNGLRDMSDQTIWDKSLDKSTDFSNIQVGELLWMKGHVGVYIGNGRAIEATGAWEGKVMVTAVENIGKQEGLHSRKWTGHSKIHVITYSDKGNGSNLNEKPKVDISTYPTIRKGSTGQYVKILQTLLLEKGYDPLGIDGKFGKNTRAAVLNFQANNTDVYGRKLEKDGIVGKLTWGALYK
jgi:hypothetical protein